MSSLHLPRRLATALLHATQVAGPAGVFGVVLADEAGEPVRLAVDGTAGGRVWAAFLGSPPGAPAPAPAHIANAARHAPRVLVAAADIQGVLRLELFEHAATPDALAQRALGIHED